MTGLGLYYRSLKHLKSKQVFYRVYYKIRSIKRRLTGFKYDYAGGNHGIKLSFQNFPLNKNSYNVRLCSKNNWSIVISNFCSDELIENHIESYIKNSRLKKKMLYKKLNCQN